MLADTDAGSLITAAQSGARWGYRMIVPELALIPVLYVAQEMTIRLGIVTGAGHGALTRQRFGRGWAMLSAGTLLLSAVGALITEFAAVAGVGELFGVSRWLTIPVATAFLVGVGMTGSYRRAERAGITLGIAELAFIPAMLLSHPGSRALVRGITSPPLGNSSYLYLLAANVGAVVMPWMIFYQQGAVVDKGLTRGHPRRACRHGRRRRAHPAGDDRGRDHSRRHARRDPAGHRRADIRRTAAAARRRRAKILFGAGMLSAALVSSLAGAWGFRRSSAGSTPSTPGRAGQPPGSTPPTRSPTWQAPSSSWPAPGWSASRSAWRS